MRHDVLLIATSILLFSCWSNPRPVDTNNELSIDDIFIKEHIIRQESEMKIIDSLSTAWSWTPDTIIGGILLERIGSSDSFNVEGDTVRLSVEVSLVNGNHCYSNDSLYLIIDHYDGPEAFNEIAKHIGFGDSCSALVPSAMGFGIKGVPGVVPPGAMIQINATLPID
tara:strand:+ start:103 stop:606 length:504 start_codon:yes stop_codon:yes gene_type:complete